jgi:hypothetical protein
MMVLQATQTASQQMFQTIFEDGSLQSYIGENIQDPWTETPFEGYVFMSPKQKGEFGERFVSEYFRQMGSNVKRAKTSTAGHDRVIDEVLTEIKFSLANRDRNNGVKEDKFMINHVSKDKDWERLVFFGINSTEEKCRFFWFSKEDFLEHLQSEDCLFTYQQAGNSVKNDDYMCTKIDQLADCSFVKGINQW